MTFRTQFLTDSTTLISRGHGFTVPKTRKQGRKIVLANAHKTSVLQMNRPFGAVDVSSNLKGAVPKTATQKILLTLAEKGEVSQKIYG